MVERLQHLRQLLAWLVRFLAGAQNLAINADSASIWHVYTVLNQVKLPCG
jgi:hypothetical protein